MESKVRHDWAVVGPDGQQHSVGLGNGSDCITRFIQEANRTGLQWRPWPLFLKQGYRIRPVPVTVTVTPKEEVK